MRPNNRTRILEAATRVVERDGVRRLTLEATAEEAGLTRGGMMYHFRDKDALMLALQEFESARWEEQLEAAAGKTAAEATPDERIAAYARVAMESASGAEFALVIESSSDPRLAEPWNVVQRRWTPTPQQAATDPAEFDRFVLRLAADGLWSYDAFGSEPITPELRAALAERISTLLSR
ncbi:TetR/AcrR family transcriptional regulator [Herbiconiux sp. YIM B11900]|uniref:TetR/AcrR family transcriptional regulator n=1 Tax=Herbiconiux sp. YIM B11900 TaxID=3404131 RepID=UPI003F8250CD